MNLPAKFQRAISPWSLTMVIIGLLLLLPFVAVFAGIFQTGPKWDHLAGTVLSGYLTNTLILVVSVSALSILFGVIPAWLVSAFDFPGRRIFSWALILPLAIPTYVAAIVYKSVPEAAIPLLIRVRATFGPEAFTWAEKVLRYGLLSVLMAAVLFPYLYLSARASFAEQRRSTIEAARTLGRTGTSIFFTVALPLARPAIAAGLALVIMEVINDYGAVNFFGVPTITEGIFRTWFGLGDRVSALRLAGLCMLAILLLILIERVLRGGRAYSDRSEHTAPLSRQRLRGPKGLFACISCLVPLIIGFLIPVFQLTRWAVDTFQAVITPDFASQMIRTLSLSLATAFALALIGLFFTTTVRLHRNVFQRGVARLATIGYAAPGAVIAVGVMITLAFLDRHLMGGDLRLSGTIGAILFAYAIRFLTVANEPLKAGITRVSTQVHEASRALGKSPLATLFRIELPLLRGSLIAAVMLVFIDILKELPLTLILRPANFETLATTAFGLAKEGQIYESAIPSMIIIFVGMTGLALMNRFTKQ